MHDETEQAVVSAWVAYAVPLALTISSLLLLTLVRDVLYWTWVWCGFGLIVADDEELEEEVAQVDFGGSINGVSTGSMAERLIFLENQLREAQSRIAVLERSEVVVPGVAGIPTGPPPPPPPAPPVMNTDNSLKIQVNDHKRRAVEAIPAAATMNDVLQEMFQVQRKVVNLISPRKAYLHKAVNQTKYAPSPLKRNMTAEWLVKASSDDGAQGSKALNNLKALRAQLNAAYERKTDNKTNGASSTLVHDPAGVAQTVLPSTADAAEVAFVGANKELPQAPITTPESKAQNEDKENLDGQDKHAADSKNPMAEGEFAKNVTMSRLRKTNIPRSPGGTTLIPQRKTSRRTLHESDFAELKDKFKKAYAPDDVSKTNNEDPFA
ncbi:hypothetical protein DFJ77DRAFT_466700 [Powellomyces hirtus]|nr:hypothetical protein DFJ77DRAFT_466700 [Powellomyces hirtus]